MPQSAQFGAGDLVAPCLDRSEVHVDSHSRNQILFKPQIGDEEAMYHVLGPQYQVDRPVHRHRHSGADDVVFARRVFFVDPDRVTGRIVYLLGISPAELAIGPRIAEVPAELLGGNFYINRSWRSLVEMQTCPDSLSHDREGPEYHKSYYRPGRFELVVSMGIHRATRLLASICKDHIAERKLSEDKSYCHDDQSDLEFRVVRASVLGNGVRQPPRLS